MLCKNSMYQQTYCGIGIVLYYFHIFTIAFGPGKIGNTSCSCRDLGASIQFELSGR